MRRRGHIKEGGRGCGLDKRVADEAMDRSRQVLEGEGGCSDGERVWVQNHAYFM